MVLISKLYTTKHLALFEENVMLGTVTRPECCLAIAVLPTISQILTE